jgi:hypothetical protein
MNVERRPVGHGSMLVYTVGRTYLIERFHSLLTTNMVRFADGPMSRRAYQQLHLLQREMRETGTVYSTTPGQHDDLAMSCCMLTFATHHPHLRHWSVNAFAERMPRPQPGRISSAGWT